MLVSCENHASELYPSLINSARGVITPVGSGVSTEARWQRSHLALTAAAWSGSEVPAVQVKRESGSATFCLPGL